METADVRRGRLLATDELILNTVDLAELCALALGNPDAFRPVDGTTPLARTLWNDLLSVAPDLALAAFDKGRSPVSDTTAVVDLAAALNERNPDQW